MSGSRWEANTMVDENGTRGRGSLDLLVIGAGMAGQTVARKCAEAGWTVAVVDELPYGGTCALRGCDPKKMLVAAAEASDWQRRMQGHGFHCRDARIDWAELQRFKRSFTDPVPEKVETGLARVGVETLHGTARFLDPDTVEIDGRRLAPRHVVIATGAEPMPLGFSGEASLTDSTRFLELEALPADVTFIGGGFVSFELAHVAARAGAKVRILEMMERPLGAFDPDMVEVLVAASREVAIDVRTETRVTAVESLGSGFEIRLEGPAGEGRIATELVVHGAGRVPRLAPLDLPAAGVEHGRRGVKVDEYLRSVSHPRVFAAGDAADAGLPLTPVAVTHGHLVAANLLGKERPVDHRATPSVVFALPPLAAVGLTETEARHQGLDVEVRTRETSDWYASRRVNERHAAFKVLLEKGSDRIAGAHLVGHGADETINLLALAIRSGIGAGELKRMLWAYPTKGSDVPFML